MSELILWRHAEAHEAMPGESDLERKLTDKGRRQAERVATWLERNLPATRRVYVSEAKRAQQTARFLDKKARVLPALNPDQEADVVMAAIEAQKASEPIVLVGHQPWIGMLIHHLLTGQDGYVSVKKGALWWLSLRQRSEESSVLVRAVVSPDLL